MYEPAEDSYMLLESALELDPARTLDLGTGCGLTAIMISKSGCMFVVATDVSPQALGCARENANGLGSGINLVRADLFSGIKGRFDLVTFNPPYLPVEPGGMEHPSWAGGPEGRYFIDRFIRGLESHLSEDGRGLMVHSSLNDLPKTRRMASKEGLKIRTVASESFFFETLRVLELSR